MKKATPTGPRGRSAAALPRLSAKSARAASILLRWRCEAYPKDLFVPSAIMRRGAIRCKVKNCAVQQLDWRDGHPVSAGAERSRIWESSSCLRVRSESACRRTVQIRALASDQPVRQRGLTKRVPADATSASPAKTRKPGPKEPVTCFANPRLEAR